MSDIKQVLEERGKTHGDYGDNAKVGMGIVDLMSSQPGWLDLTFCQKYTVIMIAFKLSRILSGNPQEPDHWVDIIGYTQLIIDRIPARAVTSPPLEETPEYGLLGIKGEWP